MQIKQAQWCVLWLLAALLTGCGGSKGPQLPKLGPSDVIIAFGDSLTFGTGAGEEQSYVAVLSQLIGRPVIGAGVPGETTAQGLERLPDVIDEHRPKLVIVCLGGNDMLRKMSEAEIAANLRAMLRKIKESGAHSVLIGVPKPALLASVPKFYAQIAEEFGVPYEGAIMASVLYSSELKADPIHPNAAGYRRIAEALALLLRKTGAV